jgi:hypothetical protein
MSRGRSTRWIVDVMEAAPDFHLKFVPGATSPSMDIAVTSGFQDGHPSKSVRTPQTASGSAAISISLAPNTGAWRFAFTARR